MFHLHFLVLSAANSSDSYHHQQMSPYRRFRALSLICASLLLTGLWVPVSAQQRPDSITVALAPEFKKEWPYGILFGNHHQLLWTAPVTVELLNLSSQAGGLTPCREYVTPDNRLLLLANHGGDTLVFTPLRERFADDEADPRDRRLIPAHPSSALVVDDIAGAIGLLRANLKLAWLPDDSLLGTFRQTYGGSAGFLATLPTRAERVLFHNSEELFRALDSDSRNCVDAHAFLLCRFIDLLTGDWHRSIWKWWWFGAPQDGWIFFRPVSTIRHHALVMLSPFPSGVHSALTPGFVNFTGDIGDVSRAMITGAALDVRILAGMDGMTWERIAQKFNETVSDSVIGAAVMKLPRAHQEIEADTLARLLRSRRNAFAAVSSRYYATLAKYAEIRLSDSPERVTIDRLDGGRVEVTAWHCGAALSQVYHRTFLPEETKEIRVHCLGGNDTVMVRGNADGTIVVRVEGGAGNDLLMDESVLPSIAAGFLGIFSPSSVVNFLYDHQGNNDIQGGVATSIVTSPPSEFVPRGKFF